MNILDVYEDLTRFTSKPVLTNAQKSDKIITDYLKKYIDVWGKNESTI